MSIAIVVTAITTAIFAVYLILLLHEDPIQFDIAVVHYKVLAHKAFKAITINYIKSAVLS